MTGAMTAGHEDPVSPVEENSVLPSTAACRRICVQVASELLPSPYASGSDGVSKGCPAIGLITGTVSHSP